MVVGVNQFQVDEEMTLEHLKVDPTIEIGQRESLKELRETRDQRLVVELLGKLDDAQLSSLAKEIISDGDNEIFLSAATAWEIAVKTTRGRLALPEDPTRYVSDRMNLHGFQALPVQIHHAVQVYKLPMHHADPFDRLLVAQSQLDSIPLISIDGEIRKYDVEVVW